MRAARQGLQDWLGEHQSHADDAVLVAAELMANAVVAARSTVVLSAAIMATRLSSRSPMTAAATRISTSSENGYRLPTASTAAGSSSSAR